ncbi:MAG: hydroxyacylglutathione hydrolase, partial [Saprospiraceae bacterium]
MPLENLLVLHFQILKINSMAHVISFTFNAFSENTYLVVDDRTKECVIFDPGCFDQGEKEILKTYIEKEGLKPVRLINTHCHLDHVFGNKFVSETFNLPLEIHQGELIVLKSAIQVATAYGLPTPEESPEPGSFIEEGDEIVFGDTKLTAIFTPGHSPASLSFYCEKDAFIIAGDVLFQGSIGRTDLPGGNFDTLINVIKTKFLTLPDEVKVHSGHGPATT